MESSERPNEVNAMALRKYPLAHSGLHLVALSASFSASSARPKVCITWARLLNSRWSCGAVIKKIH